MTPGVAYTEGDRYLASGETITLLSTDPDLVLRLWPVILDGGDVAPALAAELAGGFTSLADLILLERTDHGVEILLRGDLDVVAESSSAPAQRWDGRAVRTWREFSVTDATTVTVSGGGAPGVELPLRAGVVRASGFRWTAGSAPAASDPPTSASAPPESGTSEQAAVTTVPASAASARASADADAESKMPPVVTPPPWPEPEPTASAASTGTASSPGSVVSEPPSPPRLSTPPPSPPPPPVAAPVQPEAADTRLGPGDDFDHLFESTILRSPEDAAVRADPDEESDTADEQTESNEQLGDHDGSTILGGQLAALLRRAQRTAEEVPPPPPPGSPRIELVFSTGQIVAGDQPVVIGRKPQVDRVTGNQIPRLITVTGPNNDISRSHLEIRPDGTALLATDLGSTNGTTVVGPAGSHPLTAHIPERVEPGVRLDLGDGVTIDVRPVR